MDERDVFLQKEEAQSGELFEKLNDKIKRRNRRIFITVAVIAALLLAVAAFFGVSRFFTVEEIEVTGDGFKSEENIVSVTGIEKGQIIFLVSSSKTSKKVLDAFPMIEKATVKKVYPNKIVIDTVGETPLFIYDTGNAEIGFAVVARSEKLIGFYASKEQALAVYPGLMTVEMPPVKNAAPGKKLTYFSQGDSAYIPKLIEIVRRTDLGAEATGIDARSRFDIRVYCGSDGKGRAKYCVYLGNKDKPEEKLAFAEGIIKELPESFTGSIVVENVKNGYAQAYRD